MFKFVKGDLLESEAYALVNTVNCEGVMGKGLALQFKRRFPEMFKEYADFCKSRQLTPGSLHCVDVGGKLVINFPTKNRWRENSKMAYIASGLDELEALINSRGIKSIAIPPLGCGCGGLEWSEVKLLIIKKLHSVSQSVDIYVYEPM